ncbi:hypothetical protein DSO57_1027346 [Entomophthora muscae]|uniref:Uncharacterized protein n=1 Tax=Entomophthora muscae TaxID=34485 RepID=A0ACC2U0D6_9FUNG|nr:hypothetical protein DSO57_1027346 [Entomophthora muscae]
MMKNLKPVLDTSYKLYRIDGNQEADDKTKFYIATEGQLVLKKVVAFYTRVPLKVHMLGGFAGRANVCQEKD